MQHGKLTGVELFPWLLSSLEELFQHSQLEASVSQNWDSHTITPTTFYRLRRQQESMVYGRGHLWRLTVSKGDAQR